MKILIDNKYVEIGFWSFMKCLVLAELSLVGMIYGLAFLIGMLLD